MNKLFENIGNKIIVMAKIILILGVVVSLAVGILLMVVSEFWSGLFLLVMGLLVSIASALFTYGFGELINNTKKS